MPSTTTSFTGKGIEVTVDGTEELVRDLEDIDENLGRSEIVDALQEAADTFKNEMEKQAPKDTGFLSDNIEAKVVQKKENQVKIFIGPIRAAYWGIIQEVGSTKFPEQPWMEPSFRAKKDQAAGDIEDELEKLILAAAQ